MKYAKRCSVCQYMRKNKEFRLRMMQTSYFNPQGIIKVPELMRMYKVPFSEPSFYKHALRHQGKDRILAMPVEKIKEKQERIKQLKETFQIVESNSDSTTAHEIGLDDFIEQGRDQLARREMPISANTFLTAIRTKADIEAHNKDRKLDVLKSFQGMSDGNGH